MKNILKQLLPILMTTIMLGGCLNNKNDINGANMNDNLIPREVLFGNPDKVMVRISPKGTHFSYIAPKDGVLNIYLSKINDIQNAKYITDDRGRGIRTYFWSYNNENIVYQQDNEGDENFSLFSLNIHDNKVTRLTEKKAKADVIKLSQHFPDEMLVVVNDRQPEFFDVYRINIKTGEMKLVYENNEYLGFDVDEQFNLRFASKMLPNGDVEYIKFVDNKPAGRFDLIPYEDVKTTSIIAFDKDGKNFYTIDSRNRNTSALFISDMQGKKKLLGENNKADISDALMHPTEKHIQAYSYEYEKEHWVIIDKAIEDDIKYLETVESGMLDIVSRTIDDNWWIVAYQADDKPISYYKYDRNHKKAEFLFYHKQALAEVNLAQQHPVIIKSRDGLEMVSYLTLPLESQTSKTSIKPKQPLPLVLYVHGGPSARDSWGYSAAHQWLANRGYAVLSVNYRGSTGFGKKFISSGDGQWAAKMHDDLLDAVQWAIDNDITTRDKVAIMGGSYGGYAALVGLTFTPDTFVCGVDLVGPSSLITLANSVPPYWKPYKASLIKMIGGDPDTEDGRKFLESRSPLTYYDKIKKPLLIAQGANDPRVKQAESDQIVEKMKENNIPVTYLLYRDEGHGFARPENRMSYFAVTELFLQKCLKGKAEPIGNAFNGSSIEIVEGKDYLDNTIAN